MENDPITKNMSKKEYEDFKSKCFNSEEFFYNNYIKKLKGNENLENYSKEVFEKYKEVIEGKKKLYIVKQRRKGMKPSYLDFIKYVKNKPITPDKVFKK